MIEVEHVTHCYGSLLALDDVSMAIGARESVGLLGLNGAGKSTLMRVLAGLLRPNRGTLRIGGADAEAEPEGVRRRIGFLPDEPPLYREMRVAEFVSWCGELRGRTAAQVRKDLPEVLTLCDLEPVAHRVIETLSFGYRKRVGIAQAIIHAPDLVLLDEPVGGLDPVQIVEMREVVRRLKLRATVVISSHILSEVAQTCDRVFVIHKGRVIHEGSAQEVERAREGRRRTAIRVRGELRKVRALVRDFAADCEVQAGSEDVHVIEVALDESGREDLVGALVRGGCGVRSVGDASSPLEALFLQLTMRSRSERGDADLAPGGRAA